MRENCYKCMRPKTSCLCSATHPIETQTRFIFLMHPMEFKKEKNGTGFISHLQLSNSSLFTGIDFTNHRRINEIINSSQLDCYVLYPGDDAINLSDNNIVFKSEFNQPKVIFIIDGTWQCAKKMMRQSKNLHGLPKISFQSDLRSKFLIKQQPHQSCLSTIESVKVLLDHLVARGIESCCTDQFLAPFEKMLAYQIDCIQNPPPGSYRSSGKGFVQAKTMYKKANGRKLFFEKKEFDKHPFLK